MTLTLFAEVGCLGQSKELKDSEVSARESKLNIYGFYSLFKVILKLDNYDERSKWFDLIVFY